MSQTKDGKRGRKPAAPPPVLSQTRTVELQPPARPRFSLVLSYDPASRAAMLTLTDPANPPQNVDVAYALQIARDQVIANIAVSLAQQQAAQQPAPESNL